MSTQPVRPRSFTFTVSVDVLVRDPEAVLLKHTSGINLDDDTALSLAVRNEILYRLAGLDDAGRIRTEGPYADAIQVGARFVGEGGENQTVQTWPL